MIGKPAHEKGAFSALFFGKPSPGRKKVTASHYQLQGADGIAAIAINLSPGANGAQGS
jgi:hypothetical protein